MPAIPDLRAKLNALRIDVEQAVDLLTIRRSIVLLIDMLLVEVVGPAVQLREKCYACAAPAETAHNDVLMCLRCFMVPHAE